MHTRALPKDTDPLQAAKDAGLHYVSDSTPGISRQKKGGSFSYKDQHGKNISDRTTLERIEGIVIPPAWKDVWICPSPLGHIQATGRDERGRKQYRYHEHWQTLRNHTKFDKIVSFGFVLPKIRMQIHEDLHGSDLTEKRLLAAIVHLLDVTHMRVGNEEYAKENHSYGLTTLQNRHVKLHGNEIRFRFSGKSGVHQDIDIHDTRLANVIRDCQEISGHELFHYLDETSEWKPVHSDQVNAYIQNIAKEHFSAKDFRTWGGTVSAAGSFVDLGEKEGTQMKKAIVEAVKRAASALGNRPATCKKYYIDPRIIVAYIEQELCSTLEKYLKEKSQKSDHDLHPLEKGVHHVLQKKQ